MTEIFSQLATLEQGDEGDSLNRVIIISTSLRTVGKERLFVNEWLVGKLSTIDKQSRVLKRKETSPKYIRHTTHPIKRSDERVRVLNSARFSWAFMT